jgi:hypothetical protein
LGKWTSVGAQNSQVINLIWRPLGESNPCFQRIAGVGHRITGRSGMVNRHRGIGWEYLHVTVDDAWRLAYTARRSGPPACVIAILAAIWFIKRASGVALAG